MPGIRIPLTRYVLLILIIGLLVVIVTSCSEKSDGKKSKNINNNTLTILTLDSIRLSGFTKRIIPVFEETYKCKVDLISVAEKSELMDYIYTDNEFRNIDLVLGLDNCFLLSDEDFELFTVSDIQQKQPVNEQYFFDVEKRVIPYGFGYLCILYNEDKIVSPPESMGQLQNDRYLNQLIVSDPSSSGIGRATLLWSIALFGNSGFQQFWLSIKKNIRGSKDTYKESLRAMQSGECDMTFGFTSTPVWLNETKPESQPLKTSLMQEGSFLYIEAAAISEQSVNKTLANKFLSYLLTPDVQKYVAYDLGIFPANESAQLPEQFLTSPYSTTYVNRNLRYENPSVNITGWLDIWNKLFSRSII